MASFTTGDPITDAFHSGFSSATNTNPFGASTVQANPFAATATSTTQGDPITAAYHAGTGSASAFSSPFAPATAAASYVPPPTSLSAQNPDMGNTGGGAGGTEGGAGSGATAGGGTTTTPTTTTPPTTTPTTTTPGRGTGPRPSNPSPAPNPTDAGGQPFTSDWEKYWQQQGGAPRPANYDPNNLEQAASWYRTYPGYTDVTSQDVAAYRALVTSGQIQSSESFTDYWGTVGRTIRQNMMTNGQPGYGYSFGTSSPYDTSGNPAPPTTIGTTTNAPGGGQYNTPQPVAPNNPGAPPTPPLPPPDPVVQPTTPGTTTPGTTTPGTTTPGTTTPGTTTPGTTTPGTTTPGTTTPTSTDPNANIQSLIDLYNKDYQQNQPDMQKLLQPGFQNQQQMLMQQMQAQAALTPGRTQSGGFGQNEALGLSNLGAQQSTTMANAIQQQAIANQQQNTQLAQLATTAGMQKYTTDIQADLTKFQVNTNADLQKWLDSQDNILKKYGIDTNDVLARYQADQQLKGQMYSANKQVDAASLQAAAAGAAAAASAQASMHNAQLQYQLGQQGLNVTNQNNYANWILGLLNSGQAGLNMLGGILGQTPGGSVLPVVP